MHARYYDPSTGQFISPDSIVPEPGRIVAYNRYLYAYADPLSFSDPSGHEPLDPDPDIYPCSYTYCEWNNFSMRWEVVPQPTGHYGRFLRSAEELAQDTQSIFLVASLFEPGVIDGSQAIVSLQDGDYLGATLAGVAILPLGDIVKAARAGDNALEGAAKMLPPVDMQEAVEAAAQMAGDAAVWRVTPKGNVQFIGTEVDAMGKEIKLIGRLDVNPADRQVAEYGPHLNLERQLEGAQELDFHIRIDAATVRPWDYYPTP